MRIKRHTNMQIKIKIDPLNKATLLLLDNKNNSDAKRNKKTQKFFKLMTRKR